VLLLDKPARSTHPDDCARTYRRGRLGDAEAIRIGSTLRDAPRRQGLELSDEPEARQGTRAN